MDDQAHYQHLAFALRLHRSLTASGNACSSPYSVANALGMAYQAARGPTADELRTLLAPGDTDIAKVMELLRSASVLDTAGKGDAPVLSVANTLWACDGLTVRESFRTDLAAWPGAAIATAPFATDPEAARHAINSDVLATTNGLIDELVPPGAVDNRTVAALVNALYLRVAWRTPFAESATSSRDFHAPTGTVAVPTMQLQERLGYAAGDGWQVATLPAAGGVQAAVLLPDGELADAEAGLDAGTVQQLLADARQQQVALQLPRLMVRQQSSLTSALQALGVRRLFRSDADLSALADDERLMVSAMLHEAVLHADEAGLEGAAATAVVLRMVSAIGRPVSVRVDRPFLLLVRHAATGAVYFLARVSDPS